MSQAVQLKQMYVMELGCGGCRGKERRMENVSDLRRRCCCPRTASITLASDATFVHRALFLVTALTESQKLIDTIE